MSTAQGENGDCQPAGNPDEAHYRRSVDPVDPVRRANQVQHAGACNCHNDSGGNGTPSHCRAVVVSHRQGAEGGDRRHDWEDVQILLGGRGGEEQHDHRHP